MDDQQTIYHSSRRQKARSAALELLKNPFILDYIKESLVQNCLEAMLATDINDVATREKLHASMLGASMFFGSLEALASEDDMEKTISSEPNGADDYDQRSCVQHFEDG